MAIVKSHYDLTWLEWPTQDSPGIMLIITMMRINKHTTFGYITVSLAHDYMQVTLWL